MATSWTTPRKRADGEIVPRNILQEQYVDNAEHLKERLPELGASYSGGGGSTDSTWSLQGTSVTLTIERTADVICVAMAKLYAGLTNDAQVEMRIRNDTDGVNGATSGLFGGDNQFCRYQVGVIGYFPDVDAGSKEFLVQAQYDSLTGWRLYDIVLIAFAAYT